MTQHSNPRSQHSNPRSRSRAKLLAAMALLAVLSAAATLSQPPVDDPSIDDPSVDDTVRRIRALEHEIEELLSALPPAARAEVERRLAEGDADDHEEKRQVTLKAEPEAVAEPTPIADRGPRCRPLAVLDTDGDGQVSGSDRYWRHLYLRLDDGETSSLFDLDIRQIAVELDVYTTDRDFVGDVSVGDEAVFHLVPRRRGPSRGSLAIDADGLRRGEGPSLVDREGRPLEGIQVLSAGSALVDADGNTHTIRCGPPLP